MTLSCIARRAVRPTWCWPRSPRGCAKWGSSFTPTRRASSTAKTASAGAEHEHTSFTFLGYAFRTRGARGKRGTFTSFLPAISPEALKAKGVDLRAMRIHRRTDLSLDDLARWLNPIVAGWMHYYGRFYRTEMWPLLQRVNTYVRRWAGMKYRRLRTYKCFSRWWAMVTTREPRLFTHWAWVRTCWLANG